MRKLFKNVLAIGLVASLMMTSFTACSGKGGREKITGDTPWFNVSKADIGSDIDTTEFEYVNSYLVGTNSDEIVYHIAGIRKLPDDFDYENDDFSLYQYEQVAVYDYNGNSLGSIDLVEAYKDAHLDGQVTINNVTKDGSDFIVSLTQYSADYSDKTQYEAVIDINSLQVLAFTEVTDSETEMDIINNEGGTYSDTFHAGDFSIKTYWVAGDITSNILLLTDSSNNETIIDLRRFFPNMDILSIPNIIDIGNGQALMFGSTMDINTSYFILDLNAFTVTAYEEDMTWLEESALNLRYVEGYGSVVVDQEGVRGIDFNNHTLFSILDFNNTNVNRFDIRNATPVYISDDRIVLEGSDGTPTIQYVPSLDSIYVFDRAENNPNAGKSILKLASLGSFNYSICDSMCRFNDTNADYFIQLDTRYVIDNFLDTENLDVEYSVRSENAQQALGNQLTVDLISGVGPDIIVDGAFYSQLNSDDYLLDLSDYVAGLDSSNYFTNIIDESRTDGQLFQLPVTYNVEGIVTDASNVAPGQTGFTYDEYLEFINTVCNGTDAVGSATQTNFFLTGLTIMPDLMMEDGYVNFNNDAFIALAEYTRDHVNDVIITEEEIPEEPVAHMQNIGDMFTYLNAIKGYANDRVLLGLPSYDGRGPIVSCVNSVAVVANLSAAEQAACLDYVSILLDDNTQYQLGVKSGIPVNRNAFIQVGQDFVDSYNDTLAMTLQNMTEAQIRENGKNPNPLDYSAIEEFENLITTTGTWITSDGAINAIIREEMPAYFEGQKTLEQIIEVLENRINTLINERG